LSETLDIHPNLASKIINESLNQTFSDCINSFRVKAVINKLKDSYYEKTTFLAIAFDCGFNSKTTFNRVFKKQMGQNPLQFQKK
jgi:AraC-like DNA-binding protein